jgi:hypothetical protein
MEQILNNKTKPMDWANAKTKKIKVVPIERRGNWLSNINKDHDGTFMYSGTVARYCLPFDKVTRQLVDPFPSTEQREDIERALSFNKGDLSIYKKEDNFWKTFEIKIDKRGLVLNLEEPMDYVRYLVLFSNTSLVAPTWETRLDKGTYRFVLVDMDQEVKERAKKANSQKEAYKKLGQMEGSLDTMVNFLTVYGKTPPRESSRDFLISEIDKVIENDINGFFVVVNDEDFELKLLISKGVSIGAIVKPTKTRYELPGGDLIGNSLQAAVDYFKSPENQENYLVLKNRVDNVDNK